MTNMRLLIPWAEDRLKDIPFKRWGLVVFVGLLFAGGIVRSNGWLNMIDIWLVPWQTMPYVRLDWALFPGPLEVFCTVVGLWCVGYMMVVANRIAKGC